MARDTDTAPRPSDFWTSLEHAPSVRFGVLPEALARRTHGQVYLATPYAEIAAPGGLFHLPAARQAANAAALWARQLAELGVCAVSPVVQMQAMIEDRKAHRGIRAAAEWALDAGAWLRWCAPMLAASHSVYVPDIPGWRASAAIERDVRDVVARNGPVYVAGWP
ncbi:DUF1937 family protein [Nioella sp.]|uniref:DUF1937 family protein n=1 Tax=Nioella sp. TaxID=1912091 RepID=UPI0035174DCA